MNRHRPLSILGKLFPAVILTFMLAACAGFDMGRPLPEDASPPSARAGDAVRVTGEGQAVEIREIYHAASGEYCIRYVAGDGGRRIACRENTGEAFVAAGPDYSAPQAPRLLSPAASSADNAPPAALPYARRSPAAGAAVSAPAPLAAGGAKPPAIEKPGLDTAANKKEGRP